MEHSYQTDNKHDQPMQMCKCIKLHRLLYHCSLTYLLQHIGLAHSQAMNYVAKNRDQR